MGSVTGPVEGRVKNPWRAQVRNKRWGTKVAWFPDEDAAEEWCLQRELEWKRTKEGLPPTDDHLAKPVEQLIEEYRKRKTHKKASAPTENKVFDNFLSFKDFRTRQLRDFKEQDAWLYAEWLEDKYEWQGKPYERDGKLVTPTRASKRLKPSTVKRAIAVLRTVWKIGKRWHGYENLPNPWLEVKQDGQIKRRKRRLRKGELARIIEACKGCDGYWRYYAPVVIYLAIDTGLRLQEIFNLRWEDIDFENRRLRVQKSKTDYRKTVDGRTIVLPIMSDIYLVGMIDATDDGSAAKEMSGKLINNSKLNFKKVWESILMRAGIAFKERDYTIPGTHTVVSKDGEGLTIHDLRREAASRFARALTKYQVAVMLGHASIDEQMTVTDGYIAADENDLKAIQDKLDRYVLDGLTAAEAHKKYGSLTLVVEDGDLKPKAGSYKRLKAKTLPKNVIPLRRRVTL